MNFLNEVLKNKEEIINSLQEFLKIDSVGVFENQTKDAPFGKGVKDALLHMLSIGEKMGFKTANVDNVAGHIEFGEGNEIIGILCHVDVVPADGVWKYPPFSAQIDDGKIYARGAIDDKGPAMASLYAMKILKDLGVKPQKRIRLILGTDEETAWRGISRYLEVYETPTIGFSPDANFPLIYGEKGIMSIDIETKEKADFTFKSGNRYNVVPEYAKAEIKEEYFDFEDFCKNKNAKGKINNKTYEVFGKASHAMAPEEGINAAIILAEFLNHKLDNNLLSFISNKLNDSRFRSMGLDFKDEEMGDLTVNVAVVNIDHNGGKVGLNLRYPINWDKERFLKELTEKAKLYELEIKVLSDQIPHYVNKDEPLNKILHDAYVKYTHDHETKIMTIGGGTYARALKTAVAFGMEFPHREDVVHKANEYLIIDDMIVATAIYAEAIYNLGVLCV